MALHRDKCLLHVTVPANSACFTSSRRLPCLGPKRHERHDPKYAPRRYDSLSLVVIPCRDNACVVGGVLQRFVCKDMEQEIHRYM